MPSTEKAVSTLEVDFRSHGVRCGGLLDLPAAPARPPVVVMCHGIGGELTFGLEPFVERFVQAGIAVFRFDYRGFGRSDGEPRCLVDHRRHIDDVHAAIDHVRRLPRVDGARVALWGTSYGGGHVLRVAASRRDLRGAIAQVPFVDGLASLRSFSLRCALRATVAGLRDAVRALLRRPPFEVPVVARDGGFCLLPTSDSFEGYTALVPPGIGWRNRVPARVFLTVPAYRPARVAARIAVPVLIVAAANDSLIPVEVVRRTAARIPDCRLEVLRCGHFDVYRGEEFARTVALETAFLAETLRP